MLDLKSRLKLLFGIRHGKPFEHGHSAEFLIGCDEHCYKPSSLEPESYRKLKSIERPECFERHA